MRVRAYFEAWNARDMDLACAQWSDDCTYEDTQYAGAFEGKAALEAHRSLSSPPGENPRANLSAIMEASVVERL